MFCVSFGAGEVGGGGLGQGRGWEERGGGKLPEFKLSRLGSLASCWQGRGRMAPLLAPGCLSLALLGSPLPSALPPPPHPAPPASGSTELPGGAVGRGEGRPGAGRGPPHLTPCRKRARREPPVPVGGRHGVPGPGRPLLLARLPAPG